MSDSVQLFKALADETRLRILNLLCRRELCVCQIVEILDMGQSKVSRHLAHLRYAGLVNDRREGAWVYYALAESAGRLHDRLISWLREAENEIPDAAEDLQALENLKECGDLCPDNSGAKKGSCKDKTAAANT